MSGASASQETGQLFRGRLDRTEEIADYHRRLDSFAKILAAHSECVAVTIINGELHVTANELFRTSKENNQIFISIKEIFSYFNKLAKTGDDSEREKVFCEKICTASRLKVAFSSELVTQIAQSAFQKKKLSIADIREEYHSNAVVASQMYSLFADLYEDFCKLEDTCKSSKGQFATLKKAFKQDIKILHEESIVGIHAEMQLLAEIVKESSSDFSFFNKNKDIYIGVSKLCCLHCRCMLETAQQKLPQLSTDSLLFRVYHDLDFGWSPPDLFKMGYNAPQRVTRAAATSSSQTEDVPFLIGRAGRSQIEIIIEQHKEFSSMVDSASESEAESTFIDSIKDHKKVLEKHLKFIENLQKHGDFLDSIKTLNAAKLLYDCKSFTNFLKSIKNISDNMKKEEYLSAIVGELNSLNMEKGLTKDQLEKIMGDTNLVGEKLVTLFNEMKERISKPSLQQGFGRKLSKLGRELEKQVSSDDERDLSSADKHLPLKGKDNIKSHEKPQRQELYIKDSYG